MRRLTAVFQYLPVYRRYLGLRLYVVFVLTFVAAITESIGVTLLLPLLTALQVGESGSAGPGGDATSSVPEAPHAVEEALRNGLSAFGIQDSVPGILLFIAAVFVVKGLIKFAEGGYKSHLQAQLMREVRIRLFDAYATMRYQYYTQRNTGHFVNLINVQIQSLVKSFDKYKRFLAALITALAYFGFAFLVSWLFASMAAIAGILVLVVLRRLSHYVRRLSRKTARENGTLNHFLVQAMQAYKYLAATARVDALRTGVVDSVGRLTGYQRRHGIAQAFTEAAREPVSVAVLVSIIVAQITFFDASIAPILVALALIHRAMSQLVSVQVSWQGVMQHIGSLEMVEAEFERVSRHQEVIGRTKVGPLAEKIEFDGVYFAYDPADGYALEDISLTIPANQTVALAGESGSGKSTFVDLITLMLRPERGRLLIDGVPHSEVDLRSWREQIGYVPQETVVFDDTVANNISLWRGDYNGDAAVREAIERAAERACATRFIEALPDGFNTRVGDRGVRLSGGQRQRLFIARELYKNPRLLILDEATSALDSESELVIKESIDRLHGSTTVVIIAHRLSTIRDVDHIYVLEEGRIREHGTFDELMEAREGAFRRMVALQTF